MAGCGLYFGANAAEMQKPGAERELFSELISEIETLAAAMGIKYEKSLVKIISIFSTPCRRTPPPLCSATLLPVSSRK